MLVRDTHGTGTTPFSFLFIFSFRHVHGHGHGMFIPFPFHHFSAVTRYSTACPCAQFSEANQKPQARQKQAERAFLLFLHFSHAPPLPQDLFPLFFNENLRRKLLRHVVKGST